MRTLALVALTSGMLFLSSCGPVYNTEYTFRPPSSGSGMVCVSQCDHSKYQCRQIEDLRVDRCRVDGEREQALCEAKLAWKKGRDPKWYECGAPSCTADYDQCDNLYRSCYQACGGQVTSETRCVANCEKAVPQEPVRSSGDSYVAPKKSKANRSSDAHRSQVDSY